MPARRNVNINAGHGFNFSTYHASSAHWSRSTVTGTKKHAYRPRYVHTDAQDPPVSSQSDRSRPAGGFLPPGHGSKPGPFYIHQPQRPGSSGSSGTSGTSEYYHGALESLLAALRQGDTLKLYFCLMRFVRGQDHDPYPSQCFVEAVASIPPTTFSEILRCFDPYNVSEKIDTASGMNISYGAAVHTPLGELVNKWGVKLLYVRILNRLHRMQDARRHAKILPLLNDFVVLMRCAAATSDIRAAKGIWHAMIDDGLTGWRHSEAFGEFVKARYLTEKLYANNDLARLRLRPVDMHRSSLNLPKNVRSRLRRLESNITRLRKHRFGENMHEPYFAEPLTRVLRKRRPLMRLQHSARLRGMLPGDERLVCAFLKANGRNGRMEDSNLLLKTHWGILIQKDKKTRMIQVDGGVTYPPDSPRAPTQHLLDAIVHCYCSMGEITMAVKLVVFISRRFAISIPNKIWSDLLEYTRIMQTKPAANEWVIAQFPQKGSKASTVMDVWELCTQEPYNFQPGLRDYYNLIKSLTRKSRPMKRPIEALRQVKPLYDDAVRACDEAWCELLQTTMQHVPNHTAYRRYRKLQARKDYIWYCFHYSIRQILKMAIPNRVEGADAVRNVPNLVSEFGQFMPRWIEYHVATGYVEFASDNTLRRNLVKAQHVVEPPKPLYQRPPFVERQRDQDEWLENQWDERYGSDVEDHAPSSREGMRMEEMDAHGSEHISWVSNSQHEGEDTAPGLGQEPSSDVASGREEHSLDGDQQPSPPHLDLNSPNHSTPQWVIDRQVAQKPAYLFRPPYSGSVTQPSILSIRQAGGHFTGYHDDKFRRHFAARRVFRTTVRAAGVPVDLGLGRRKGLQGKRTLSTLRGWQSSCSE
ncbi:hypothetical protein VMCG_10494 [Cytospora schulzeri]|uniref:Uncharacterized protein n=1 Tax=Cytospora schulzeri TaxID=448051 RepID=A0A423VBQ5_9PEZI|nr:hypothetical protein VMCG_10494 [Valsa malicola]